VRTAIGAARGAAATSSDVAYQSIKAWILAGEIPLGLRLGEERVAARLSMSRTPVREALLRLSAERFVERHADGGYRVNHPRTQLLGELYDVRRALELFALQQVVTASAADRAPLADLGAQWSGRRAVAPECDPDFVLLDEAFHTDLAATTGNAELVASLQRVVQRIRPVRTHDFLTPGRIVESIDQHVAILDAAVAGDPRAVPLLDAHISESQRYVEAAMGRVLDRIMSLNEEELEW